MDGVNEKYNIKLEVLTPLTIGVGAEMSWVNGIDYVIKDDCLYRLDMSRMLDAGIDIEKLSACFLKKDDESLMKLIGSKLEDVTIQKFKAPCKSFTDIKPMVCNQLSGNPLVPGSSLKGAIRSHILTILGDGEKGDEREGCEYVGKTSSGENFMRFIKVQDFEFLETALVNTKIFNLQKPTGIEWEGGWKHERSRTDSNFKPDGFNTVYESLLPGQTSIGSLMFSPVTFDKLNKSFVQQKKDKKLEMLSLNNLFRKINEQTRSYLQKEKRFFEKFSTEHTDDIVRNIDNLLERIGSDGKSCVLKMSLGSGYHSISGDWRYDDYCSGELGRKGHENAKPKSRKIALRGDEFYLMGFMKLSVATDAEVEEHAEALRQKTENQKAELLKTQQKEQEKLFKEQYDTLIRRAQSSDAQNCFDEALSMLQEAEKLLPSGTKHKELLENVVRKIEIRNLERLKIEADDLRKAEKWSEAKAKYEQLRENQYKIDEVEKAIADCDYHLTELTFEVFMDRCSSQLQNIDAFANYLKKWTGPYEVDKIVAKLKEILASKDKNGRAPWLNPKKWGKMEQVLGKDICEQVQKAIAL